ncbi:MAG: PepSY-associated TM helix family [Puniceicoccaceae bacterium 5H]|nr:MAG: PepSY-associated TM helix family [Puniceicoccaceae bacterium 5H]
MLGLFCALGLIVLGVTGSVLVFHREIAHALWPENTLVSDETPTAEERLPLPQLIAETDAKFPEYWMRGWLPRYGSEARDNAYMTKRGTDDWFMAYVDPYTGESVAEPVSTEHTFYGWFVTLHYTLFTDHWGMALTALFALGFLGLSVTGVYIYRNFWKSLFRLRWRQSARIFTSDLHKMVGIASIPFNFIFGVTGAYWNIDHIAHEMLEHHDHAEVPVPYEGDVTAHLGSVLATAQETIPDYTLNYVYLPTGEDANVYLYGQTPEGHPFRSPYGTYIWINYESGEVTYTRDLRTAGLWNRVKDAFEPLHFGNFGGIVSKLLWCLAGLFPAILAGSGTWIWWHRKRTLKKRKAQQRAKAAAQPQKQESKEPVATHV